MAVATGLGAAGAGVGGDRGAVRPGVAFGRGPGAAAGGGVAGARVAAGVGVTLGVEVGAAVGRVAGPGRLNRSVPGKVMMLGTRDGAGVGAGLGDTVSCACASGTSAAIAAPARPLIQYFPAFTITDVGSQR